ncbi:P-loop containing nucleoside triphosphate hydrolase protein [Armillaria fumosa]|nr:P-loop containing nucleoside triphosphate hydrolase protein [Armillaria fumosa]
MPSPENLKKRKIAVLGARSVGKSSLIVQFVENRFVENYYPTIQNTFAKSVSFKGTEYDCEVIDTAGQDEYSILNSKYAIGIHGYVLVYSVTSRSSFDMIQVLYDKIVDFCGVTEIPCVIVGSKVDLSTSKVMTQTYVTFRQVPAKDGEALAQTNNAVWVETSAKENINVGKVFDLCLGEIEKHSPTKQGEPPANRCVIM